MINFLGTDHLPEIIEGHVSGEVNNMVWEETTLEAVEQVALSINDAVGDEVDEGI